MWHQVLLLVLGLFLLLASAAALTFQSTTALGGAPVSIQRALRALAAQDFSRAERILRNALQRNPRSAAHQAYLGHVLHRQEKLAAATAAYRRALDLPDEKIGVLESSHAYASDYLGQILKSQGHLEAARIAFQQVVAFKPNSDLAHFNLGQVLKSQGKFTEALAAFRQAIAIAPQYGLTVAYEYLGNDADRVLVYRRAIELAPNHADNYGFLGKALYDRGQLGEAAAAYRRATKLNPFSARYYNRLGGVLYENGEFDEAVAVYERALAVAPSFLNVEARNTIGKVMLERGKFDEAIAIHSSILTSVPNAEAQNGIGIALYRQGKLQEAISSYRTALEIDPHFLPAHANLREAAGSLSKSVLD